MITYLEPLNYRVSGLGLRLRSLYTGHLFEAPKQWVWRCLAPRSSVLGPQCYQIGLRHSNLRRYVAISEMIRSLIGLNLLVNNYLYILLATSSEPQCRDCAC